MVTAVGYKYSLSHKKIPKATVVPLPQICNIPDFIVLGRNFLWGKVKFFNFRFKYNYASVIVRMTNFRCYLSETSN